MTELSLCTLQYALDVEGIERFSFKEILGIVRERGGSNPRVFGSYALGGAGG